MIITKKTLTPYYISLIYLLLLLGESIEKCFLIEQYGSSEEKDARPSKILNWPGDPGAVIKDMLYTLKTLFFVYFIIQRILSEASMLFFMVYQSQLKISELDLAKQGF